ncbi:MAG: 2Fe-2S iron-sulfur cluster-binding protein [Eubacteriales bacterium]|nr:2Fe-2S iron-sulfur cluster-binding protein [Eubacteriales bacterium]
MLKIKIDEKDYECEKGTILLDFCRKKGINIPTLCEHGAIAEVASCRLCICEVIIKGRSQVVVSCVYPIEQECEILTHSEKIDRERGVILMLLKLRAPESKEIQELCEKYKAPEYKRFKTLDGGKCIMCGKCALVCKELGSSAISTINRGISKEISTPYGEPNITCIGCLSCAHVCPTQAINFESDDKHRKIWGKEFKLVYCKDCKKPIGTVEEIEYAKKKTPVKDEDAYNYCDECRRLHIAKVMAATYGEVETEMSSK